MAKFNEEEWKRQMARDIAEEAALSDVSSDSDAELRRELTDMFGTSDYDAIIKAIGHSEGFSDKEVAAMQKAGKLAKKRLQQGRTEEAEKIIMSNRGLREARKRSKDKGYAVLGLLGLGSAFLSVWGLIEVGAAIVG